MIKCQTHKQIGRIRKMMAKGIELLVVYLTQSIRHQGAQIQVPVRLEVSVRQPAMPRGRTRAIFALLLSIGIFSLPIAAKAQPGTSDELKSTSGTIEHLTSKV